ncbi:hypothetical protein G6672_02715 [Polynucleobacter paneuropaeus]|nr:hypothetical protein [Polynucleobacter paneuropaeus]
MNGLIGNNTSAKFIFLGCNDESEVPPKKDIKQYYPDSPISIYKAWGNYRDSFSEVEALFNMRLNGVDKHSYYTHSSKRCITHAIRLDSACDKALFFELKYSHVIVSYLNLSHTSLEALGNYLRAIAKVNSEISTIIGFSERLKLVKSTLNTMSLHDPKVDKPCEKSISTLLDGYGKNALVQMNKAVDKWYEENKWV